MSSTGRHCDRFTAGAGDGGEQRHGGESPQWQPWTVPGSRGHPFAEMFRRLFRHTYAIMFSGFSEFLTFRIPRRKEHVSRQSTQTRAELRKIAGICQKGGASNCSCSLIAGVWSDATVEICWMLRHLFQVRSQKPDYCRLVGCQCPVLFCLSHDLQWFSLTSLTLFPEACPEISSRDKVIMKDTINEPSPRFYIFCCGLWIAKILNIDGLRLLAWKDCVGWFSTLLAHAKESRKAGSETVSQRAI